MIEVEVLEDNQGKLYAIPVDKVERFCEIIHHEANAHPSFKYEYEEEFERDFSIFEVCKVKIYINGNNN